MVRSNTSHGFLLSTKRGRNKLSRKDMLLLLRNTTQSRLGKRLGVQTTENIKSIDKALELQRELGHGAVMQPDTFRKPDWRLFGNHQSFA